MNDHQSYEEIAKSIINKFKFRAIKERYYSDLGDRLISSVKAKGFMAIYPGIVESDYGLVPLNKAHKLDEALHDLIPREEKGIYLKALSEHGELCFDIVSNEYFYYDFKMGEMVAIPPKGVFSGMPPKLVADYKSSALWARFVYDVKNAEPYRDVIEGKEGGVVHLVKRINRYKPPFWREIKPESSWLSNMPTLAKKLLNASISDEHNQNVLLSWFHNALVDSNQTILVNRGARGCGKTTITKLFAYIIGDYLKATDDQDQFTAEYRDKRIVYFDDHISIGTRAGHIKRKTLTDKLKTLKEKHVQTRNSEVVFTSYIINSNPSDNYYNEYDDRKSVYVAYKDININKVLTEAELAFLDGITLKPTSELDDKEKTFIASLGYYLLHYDPIISPTQIHLTDQFWEDVRLSLPAFKRFILTMALNGDEPEISYRKSIMLYKKLGNASSNIDNFSTLMKFFDGGFLWKGHKIFTVIDKDKTTFTVNEEIRENKEIQHDL